MLPGVSDSDDPPRREYKLKPKEFERVNAPRGTEAKSDDHDVFAIRRQVREREQAAGMDHITAAPPKKSKRARDFWVSLIFGWGLLMAIGFMTTGLIGLLAGAALGLLYVVGIWWIFYHILDDY